MCVRCPLLEFVVDTAHSSADVCVFTCVCVCLRMCVCFTKIQRVSTQQVIGGRLQQEMSKQTIVGENIYSLSLFLTHTHTLTAANHNMAKNTPVCNISGYWLDEL